MELTPKPEDIEPIVAQVLSEGASIKDRALRDLAELDRIALLEPRYQGNKEQQTTAGLPRRKKRWWLLFWD